MSRLLLTTALLAAIATPALAQVGPAVGVGSAVPGIARDARGVASRPIGSTGDEGARDYSPTGLPQDVISNDSAQAGNAGQPSRVAPQGSGGGGNGGN